MNRPLLMLTTLALIAPACLDRPLETIEPRLTTTVNIERTQSRVDKIDILLAIDDSGSMADKQDILAVAVPDLVNKLVNPPCLDNDGNVVVIPAGALEECPEGSRREFEPVLDIHIGVVSTSLGEKNGYAQAINCEGVGDGAKLLSRISGGSLDTFENKGFLVWEPEAEGSAAGRYADPDALNGDLQQMVTGVGDIGCGYEHTLESWYRFLIDPDPYFSIRRDGDRNKPEGSDLQLLQQREDFLRDDSLVAIVMLSDENDCSFRDDGYGYYTATNASHEGIMRLKARNECATNPDDVCCTPCGFAPETCPTDPTCDQPQPAEKLYTNLTCFDQKRRYGVDLLQPIDRYVAGLTQTQISDRHGNVVDNPLLVSKTGVKRGKDRVYLTGIVGVPWQLLARNPADLGEGFQGADELSDNGTWSKILGDPAERIPASDPHMVESIEPRDGLPGPTSGVAADPMNGHEYVVGSTIGDLQYACIFDLNAPLACPDNDVCDCNNGNSNNPLCQASDGSYSEQQLRAKAYPSLRQLEVLKGVGNQGIVGSICPAQFTRPEEADFGYRPAIEALVERLKAQLSDPCLPREFKPDHVTGEVACIVLEAHQVAAGDSCNCEYAAGRQPVASAHQPAVSDARQSKVAIEAGVDCFCQIGQLQGEQLDACRNNVDEEPRLNGEPIHGWCYVDDNSGNEQLISHCRETERHIIRFIGEGEPVNDSLIFITCSESNI